MGVSKTESSELCHGSLDVKLYITKGTFTRILFVKFFMFKDLSLNLKFGISGSTGTR